MSSPWGNPDSIKKISKDIALIGTPSHGGYRVLKSFALDNMSDSSIIHCTYSDKDYLWYEEDCDWCIVVIENPCLFTPKELLDAFEVAKIYHCEYLFATGQAGIINIDTLKRTIDKYKGLCGRVYPPIDEKIKNLEEILEQISL